MNEFDLEALTNESSISRVAAIAATLHEQVVCARLGKVLRARLHSEPIPSQQSLATSLGMSRAKLSHLLSGKSRAAGTGHSNMMRILATLNVPPSHIYPDYLSHGQILFLSATVTLAPSSMTTNLISGTPEDQREFLVTTEERTRTIAASFPVTVPSADDCIAEFQLPYALVCLARTTLPLTLEPFRSHIHYTFDEHLEWLGKFSPDPLEHESWCNNLTKLFDIYIQCTDPIATPIDFFCSIHNCSRTSATAHLQRLGFNQIFERAPLPIDTFKQFCELSASTNSTYRGLAENSWTDILKTIDLTTAFVHDNSLSEKEVE